jgi:hypothetical protein
MTNQLTRAQPPLEFIPPRLNPLVLQSCQLLLPLWLQSKTNLTEIRGDRLEILADLYHRFQQGKIRFLMAFRHPSINDPYCMGYLLWKLLPQAAKAKRIQLSSPLHAHFIYDRGIPLWAGVAVGWLFSRLGGSPIQRGKADLMGLRSIRSLFTDGIYPLAASPEGGTNGHNEVVSSLEPGLAQFGFWCIDDLRKQKRDEEVFIVPIGIQYHYITPPWKEIENILTQLESESGLTSPPNSSDNLDEFVLYQRLFKLGEHLLSLMEDFYRQNYHKSLPKIEQESDPNQILGTRLKNLLNVALDVAEQYFNLSASGNLIDRCRRLEQAGWDCIYREDFKDSNSVSLVEKGLADRLAEEASLRMWNMRIVESFTTVTGQYVKEKPSAERFAETILLLWDLVTKIKGENAAFRPQLGKQRVQMTIGEPLSVSERWDSYKANRRQAVADITQDLQIALEGMIIRS